MKSIAFVLIVLLCACGDDGPSGPYDDLPIDERVTGTEVDAPVDVVRDEYGVAHVRAGSVGDLAFAQGYVMASDRIQQMDLFRHFASGRISELFGALDPAQIDGDLEMRIHRFEATAQATWEELEASSDPEDVELATFLQRFSDGVNRYVADLVDGTRTIDPEIRPFFDPTRMRPWTPADSLVIGRLQAMTLSYSDSELGETDVLQRAEAAFDDAVIGSDLARRTGIFQDLVRIAPADPTATRDGFPSSARVRPPGARPQVPAELLARVQRPLHRLFDTRNGSNNWVVGPDLAGGRTLMANDPHLTLASPSIFYAMHLTIPGDVDVAGITFPGIPGIILGHNEHIAWGATTVNHDVTDFYLEEIAPCPGGGGDCVTFDGGQVPIESWEETLDIGALGTITESRTVTFERVPHHGPILPTIVDHDTAPRPAGPAISVRYTGHEPTYELAAFRSLWRATTAEEGMAAMRSFGFGAQNWVFTDDTGHIGWTTHALVPWRTQGCFTYDPATGDGVAPWWIVPGDGSCEWDGYIEAEHLPQDYDPARGFLATANQDPVGATFDGDPTNTVVDGKVLYVGARDYDEGYRVGRITRRLEALAEGGAAMTADDMASIQADAHSNLGSALTPAIFSALDRLEAELATPGTHDDLETFAAGLSPAQVTRIAEGRAVLEAWSFDAAVDGGDGAATVLFNVWLVDFLDRAFEDETAVIGRGAGGWLTNTVVAVLTTPEVLRTGLAPETGEPLLCDDLATPGPEIESCTLMVVRAFDAALGWIATSSGLGADPSGWRWGDLHRLTLEPLIPLDALRVGDGDVGFARHGDNHSVDASSPGMDDLEFSYGHGPAMRHVTVLGGGEGPRTLLAIPGGQVMDTGSPHWRDLMDQYWSVNEYFELPWTVDQVIERAESRWRFE